MGREERTFRNLPPGTLAGLDALTECGYWERIMSAADIELSDISVFRCRFAEINRSAANRLAFLAGSGEYGTFNIKFLIGQLVEQCTDMHRYTRRLENYVARQAQQHSQPQLQHNPHTQQAPDTAEALPAAHAHAAAAGALQPRPMSTAAAAEAQLLLLLLRRAQQQSQQMQQAVADSGANASSDTANGDADPAAAAVGAMAAAAKGQPPPPPPQPAPPSAFTPFNTLGALLLGRGGVISASSANTGAGAAMPDAATAATLLGTEEAGADASAVAAPGWGASATASASGTQQQPVNGGAASVGTLLSADSLGPVGAAAGTVPVGAAAVQRTHAASAAALGEPLPAPSLAAILTAAAGPHPPQPPAPSSGKRARSPTAAAAAADDEPQAQVAATAVVAPSGCGGVMPAEAGAGGSQAEDRRRSAGLQ
eukprot:XP_001694845.1 predicted protein [Chlamydomonas reinhardtii]